MHGREPAVALAASCTRGSVIGRVIRESGVGIDVHVISHPSGRARGAFARPARARPSASAAPSACVIGFGLAASPASRCSPSCSRSSASTSGCRASCCSSCSSSSASSRRRRALAGARPRRSSASCSSTGTSRRRSTPSRSPKARTSSRSSCSWPSPRSSAASSALAARRTAEAARDAGRGRGARPPCAARHRPRAVARRASSGVLGLDGAAVLHREGEQWRIEASAACAPRRAGVGVATVDLDDEHVLALAGRPLRSEDERILEAFARELAASVELGDLQAEVEQLRQLAAANELRAAILSAVSHDLRTPSRPIKASVTSLLQDDIEWSPRRAHEFLSTIDEETDRLNGLVGNLLDMSRHPGGRARDRPRRRWGSKRCSRRPFTASASRPTVVDLDVPETLPRVHRRPRRCSSGPWPTSSRTLFAFSPADRRCE